MLSIASWRSGSTKAQEPETADKVALRATPVPAEPAPGLAPPPPAFDGDHRGSPRRLAATVPSISGLTLSPYGAAASLVNISTSGLLAESGVPLKIGNFVKVIFEGAFAPQSVEGRVVRISVASMASTGVRYNIGVAFKVPLELESEVTPQSRADKRPAAVAVANPPQAAVLVNRW
jgi:hypothetical protein